MNSQSSAREKELQQAAAQAEYQKELWKERAKKRSSKEEHEMSPERIINIFESNKLFHHLYDPYYDQKEVRQDMAQTLIDSALKHEHTNKVLNPNSYSFPMVIDSLPVKEQRKIISEIADQLNASTLKIQPNHQKFKHFKHANNQLKNSPKSATSIKRSSLQNQLNQSGGPLGTEGNREAVYQGYGALRDSNNYGNARIKSQSNHSSKLNEQNKYRIDKNGDGVKQEQLSQPRQNTKSNTKVAQTMSIKGDSRNALAVTSNKINNQNNENIQTNQTFVSTIEDNLSTLMSHNKEYNDKQQNDRYQPQKGMPASQFQLKLKKERDERREVRDQARGQTSQPMDFKKSIQRLILQAEADAKNNKNMDQHTRKTITMNTEDQLYKFKQKIYPPTSKLSIVEGFSLFFDEATRQAIKQQVKKEMLRQKKEKLVKKGQKVDNSKFEILDDNQVMLKLLDQSEKLIRATQELQNLPSEPQSMHASSRYFKHNCRHHKSQNEKTFVARGNPFGHLKVKNIDRILSYLRQQNDKDAQIQIQKNREELEMKKRVRSQQQIDQSINPMPSQFNKDSKQLPAGLQNAPTNHRMILQNQAHFDGFHDRLHVDCGSKSDKHATTVKSDRLVDQIEKKLIERQRKKQCQLIYQRQLLINNQQRLRGRDTETESNFDLVNKLYDKTNNYLQKSKLNYIEPIESQRKVSEETLINPENQSQEFNDEQLQKQIRENGK